MSEIEVYKPRQRNTMMIKNLCPGLVELGKIKIGNKGAVRKSQGGNDWQAPQKLDHFLITTNERGADNNFILDESLHKIFGDAPKSIRVMLIYDDISLNFATRYICYYGKTVFCSGDGECAQRLQKDGSHKEIACPCERQDPKYAGEDGKGKGKCKINGILSVVIDGAQTVGGVWKFRTTSYNSVVGILSSLAMIQRITGGRLAGIPMVMTVSPKTVANPLDGKQQTIYVVGLQYAGTMVGLRDTGYRIAMDEAKHGISMNRIEEDAMLMLAHKPVGGAGLGDDLDQDVIDEFYPEESKPDAPGLVGASDANKPATTAGTTAGNGGVAGTPPLAAVTAESEIIDIDGEDVDTTTGEVANPIEKTLGMEQTGVPTKPKGTRSAKAKMAAANTTAGQGAGEEQPPHPGDEEGWPDPPTPGGRAAAESAADTVSEGTVEEPAKAETAVQVAETQEADGDLF